MSENFLADRIEREKPDPVEGSSTRWLAVPPMLLSLFLGFGITYLWLQTDSLQFREGDMRSPVSATENAESEQSGESLMELGGTVYKRNCQACHQANGQGLGAAFPPLAGSQWVNGSPERLSAIVLYGLSGEIEVQGKTCQGAMPSFKGKLSEEELAAVTSYVRNSWGNSADPVSSELVKTIGGKLNREGPWKGQAELDSVSWE